MGMTIDEAIHDTEVMKEYLECRGEIRSEGLGILIDIAHKYQKIEQILDDWKSDSGVFEVSGSYWLKQIREVIEDGNDR